MLAFHDAFKNFQSNSESYTKKSSHSEAPKRPNKLEDFQAPDMLLFTLGSWRRSAAERGQQKKCSRIDAAAEMEQRKCSRGGAGEGVQQKR